MVDASSIMESRCGLVCRGLSVGVGANHTWRQRGNAAAVKVAACGPTRRRVSQEGLLHGEVTLIWLTRWAAWRNVHYARSVPSRIP